MGRSSAATLPDDPSIRIPAAAATLDGFRAWAVSGRFPERGRFSFIGGELHIDMSPEELDTHNKVKAEVGRSLGNLSRELDPGEYYSGGTLVTNEAAGLSTEPDGTFVTWRSFETGRVRLTTRPDRPGQYVELVGSPDWVLEVVSRSSVAKDTQALREAYHRSGILEYWIIDARFQELDFQLLKRRRDGYAPVPARGGWRRSAVFGRGVLLERRRSRLGRWDYTLRVSSAAS
jgi:Uma2 family endonuclease